MKAPASHLFIFILCLISFQWMNAQSLNWALTFDRTGTVRGYQLAIDSNENLIITGIFTDTLDLDPGPGLFNVYSTGDDDVFICKLGPAGQFIAGGSISGGEQIRPLDIALDRNGNIYLVGDFLDTVDFDPGPGSFNMTAKARNGFVLKLDTLCRFIWAFNIGGNTNEHDEASSIAIDTAGNILIFGLYRGTVDFDPSTGVHHMTATGYSDAFLLKLDSVNQLIWVKTFRGPGNEDSKELIIGHDGHFYLSGRFNSTPDFDPGPGVFQMVATEGQFKDGFLVKLDENANFIWAKQLTGPNYEIINSIVVDREGNLYHGGSFYEDVDFDPGPNRHVLDAGVYPDAYISKWDRDGNFQWVKRLGNGGHDSGSTLLLDPYDRLHFVGSVRGDGVDFDPGPGVYELGSDDINAFYWKLDNNGNFISAISPEGIEKNTQAQYLSIALNKANDVFVFGYYYRALDFDPGPGQYILNALNSYNAVLLSYTHRETRGCLYRDENANCEQDSLETSLAGIKGIINPSGILVETNALGNWHLQSLPAGSYTVTYDTTGRWKATCPNVIPFTVLNSNLINLVPKYGMSSIPCHDPYITLIAPVLRRCFSSQKVYISACNLSTATTPLLDGYVLVYLDSMLILESASIQYAEIGPNTYRFDVGTIAEGECVDFYLEVMVSCDAILGQTICMKADIFPSDSCIYYNGPIVPHNDPCTQTWDRSNLIVSGDCHLDSLFFKVENTAQPDSGNMTCSSEVRVYVNGLLLFIDSVKLNGGENRVFKFPADGRTWRLEADQHPLHPGQSNPGATIELCGNLQNWTDNLVTLLAEDDANAETDIYCGIITGSFDPNDKTGFPIGVNASHSILPDGKIDYLIRFQNTGNDTAFSIYIQDTLDSDLDIFSIRNGVSSHEHLFRIISPNILEWYFPNIMLPDSNINLKESNGFVSFSVWQKPGLSNGSIIENKASIFFDYNEPVITNTTAHTINTNVKSLSWEIKNDVYLEACYNIEHNGVLYDRSGTYYQVASGGIEPDTLVILHINLEFPYDQITNVYQTNNTIFINETGYNYQWLDCTNQSIIPGANEPFFNPAQDGHYAVILSSESCMDTSTCFAFHTVGILNNSFQSLRVSPNPTKGNLTIQLEDSYDHLMITLINTMGKILDVREYPLASEITYVLDEPPGLYFLQINAGNNSSIVKVLKL